MPDTTRRVELDVEKTGETSAAADLEGRATPLLEGATAGARLRVYLHAVPEALRAARVHARAEALAARLDTDFDPASVSVEATSVALEVFDHQLAQPRLCYELAFCWLAVISLTIKPSTGALSNA